MKNRCAFTICTRSYIGLAEALKSSFTEYNSDYDFFIVIADYEIGFSDKSYVLDAKEVMGVEEPLFYRMAFQYNVTEFCTSIKPFTMKWAFRKGYELAIYLDPDILAFSSFDEIDDSHSVYLTPHMLDMFPKAYRRWKEPELTMCGVYNCGFAAIRNDSTGNLVADWWSEKLKDGAFSDIDKGMYTDQKWMDYIACFIDTASIKIIKDPGYDVAPWNFHERELIKENNGFEIRFRGKEEEKKHKLVFLHYSGYRYGKLIGEDIIESNYYYDYIHDEFDELVEFYRNKLIEEKTAENFGLKYLYGFFKNGVMITDFNRRMYRCYVEKSGDKSNPFETGKDSFYELLGRAKMLSKQSSTAEIKRKLDHRSRKERVLQNLFKMVFNLLKADKYYYFIWKVHDMTRTESSYFLMEKYVKDGDGNDS